MNPPDLSIYRSPPPAERFPSVDEIREHLNKINWFFHSFQFTAEELDTVGIDEEKVKEWIRRLSEITRAA